MEFIHLIRDVFTDDMFLPSMVTDIPLQQDDLQTNEPANPAQPSGSLTLENSEDENLVDNHSLLTTISPYPKALRTRKRSNRYRFKSAIITDTPEKQNILARRAKSSAKRTRPRPISSSSESCEDVSLASYSESGDEDLSFVSDSGSRDDSSKDTHIETDHLMAKGTTSFRVLERVAK